jgi:NDP-sugar pyrophosphorylase family protein
MLKREVPVRTFLHNGLWLDIGRIEDFQRAQELAFDEEAPAFETTPAAFETAAA